GGYPGIHGQDVTRAQGHPHHQARGGVGKGLGPLPPRDRRMIAVVVVITEEQVDLRGLQYPFLITVVRELGQKALQWQEHQKYPKGCHPKDREVPCAGPGLRDHGVSCSHSPLRFYLHWPLRSPPYRSGNWSRSVRCPLPPIACRGH